MSDYNQFNIRHVGERVRLPGMSVSISEKKKDDGITVRWVQFPRFN